VVGERAEPDGVAAEAAAGAMDTRPPLTTPAPRTFDHLSTVIREPADIPTSPALRSIRP